MTQQPQDLSVLYSQLADTFGALLTHPECPDALANRINDFFCEVQEDASRAAPCECSAAQVRAALPDLLKLIH